MSKTIDFGIDLGTTNSAIARYKDGQVEIFKNPLTLKSTLPSVIAYRKKRVFIGDKAKEVLSKDSQNTVAHFKRKMGTTEKYFIPNLGSYKTPIELSIIILKELKQFVYNEEKPTSVVITIPAAFDTVQSNATKNAGLLAGFSEVVLLQEPIAASLAYANNANLELDANKKWMVYDLGGGTFDVALISLEGEEMKVIDHEGDNFLGGTDIDALILDKLFLPQIKEAGQFGDLDAELKRASGKYAKLYNLLLYKAEEAKIMLSNMDEVEIEFEIKDDNDDEIDIFFSITRAEFDELIIPVLSRTGEMIEQVIERNNIDKKEIDFMLMVGGSTYIPVVRDYITNKIGIPVNYQIDPITAVAIGAAYYAGMKISNVTTINHSQKKSKSIELEINMAFDKVARESETMFLAKIKGNTKGKTYRIVRLDGGFDTGKKDLSNNIFEELPLVENVYNEFILKIYDTHGDEMNIEIPSIGIMHGMYSIDGQPLPEDICLEVDALKEGTTMLEPIFKKNSILPLKRSIVKEVSKSIFKNSEEAMVIKLLEGSVDNLPAANKTIGYIKIEGKNLNRDLIKGSDVELTFEMSESRDLKVEVYLTLTGQEYVNVFSPKERLVDMAVIRVELETFATNLIQKQQSAEQNEQFEEAGQAKELLEGVRELLLRIDTYKIDDITDEKYQIEIQKRALAGKLNKLFKKTLLTKILEKYYELKASISFELLFEDSETSMFNKEFHRIVEKEKEYLLEANPSFIKIKTEQLRALIRKINSRSPVTNEDIVNWFYYLKQHSYKDTITSNSLFQEGEDALNNNNIPRLSGVVNRLYQLKNREDNEDNDLFKSKGTGIR